MKLQVGDQFLAIDEEGQESSWELKEIKNKCFQMIYVINAIEETKEEYAAKLQNMKQQYPFLPTIQSMKLEQYCQKEVTHEWLEKNNIRPLRGEKYVYLIYEDEKVVAVAENYWLDDVLEEIQTERGYTKDEMDLYIRVERHELNKY